MSQETEKQKKREKTDALVNAGLAGSHGEVVGRYGAANKEHLVAYSGMDNETGQKMSKGLKSISKHKVNADYKDANLKQQAGYSAEVKTVARDNAENIISGNKKGTRTTRTDDMQKQSNGKGGTVGGVNEQIYDIAEVKNGVYVEGSGRQLKFVGKNPKACADTMLSENYDKYRNADAKLEVPSDYYDGVKQELAEKAESVKKQIAALEKQGNAELVAKKKAELEKIQKTSKNLKKGNTSSKEAMEARVNPELSTVKDIADISHRAGLEAAQSGAVIGGGFSMIRNVVAVVKGDKEADEAVLDVVKDTGSAAAVSYGTAFAGSAVKGGMQNFGAGAAAADALSKAKLPALLDGAKNLVAGAGKSLDKAVQGLSKTNLPGVLVTTALETGKTFYKYFNGEIDGVQCLEELGEKGAGMASSAIGTTVGSATALGMFGKSVAIGQLAIPIPVVGGLIGGMVGYALSSAFYSTLMNSLKAAKLAKEERARIEAECAKAIKMIREYRAEMEAAINAYLSDHQQTFHLAIDSMKHALDIGDVDGFIAGANTITRKLGGTPQFNNTDEFRAIMRNKAVALVL